MMLAAVLVLALSAQGKPISLPAATKGSAPNGNSTISYEIYFTDTGPRDSATTCERPCHGEKHLTHQQCDSSCDGKCLIKHVYDNSFAVAFDGSAELKGAATKMGLGADLGTSVYNTAKEVFYQFADSLPKPKTILHWNFENCSVSTKTQPMEGFQCFVHYSVTRTEEGPDGRKIVVQGPSGDDLVGYGWYPTGPMGDAVLKTRCYCEIAKPIEKTATGVDEHVSAPTITVGDGPQVALNPLEFGKCGGTLVCGDMNHCQISLMNPYPMPVHVEFPSGTMLYPSNDSYQEMMLIDPCVFDLPAGGQTLFASLNPGGFTSSKVRIVCTNVSKKEPEASVKYGFRANADPGTRALAENMSKERFRGPWSQARIWCYTDAAPYDKIASVMFPHPTAGRYMGCVKEAEEVSGTGFDSDAFRSCFDPKLSLTPDADLDDLAYYDSKLVRNCPGPLAAFLKGHTSDFTKLFQGDESAPARASLIVNECASSTNKDLKLVALTLLEKGVPEANRPAFLAAGGLGAARFLAGSEDKRIADRAKSVLGVFGLPR